ncbi:mRNA surveillance protein pelota [[Eubacterium] cellulosolvens]
MKILVRDIKHGVMKLALQNIDDLWVLYNVIQKGDQIVGRTTREVKSTEAARPSSKRVPVTLGITVRKVYFDRDLDRLRIHGIVFRAPEQVRVTGSHHTLSVGPEDVITLLKDRWLNHQVERVEKALVAEEPIIVLALDSEEASVAVLRSFGLDFKGEVRSRLPGKAEAEKREVAVKEYLHRIQALLDAVCVECSGPLLIVGPGFTKDHFFKELKSEGKHIGSRSVAVKTVGSGGIAGVHEAIRVGAVSKIRRDSRALQETELVNEALKRLGSSSGNVSYGLEPVEADTRLGAVETLIVADQVIREAQDEERSRIEATMRKVEERGGRVALVSSEQEAGKMLQSLGGVAALLRYRLHQG